MAASTPALTDFLLARIADDETCARDDGPNQPHGRYCGWALQEGSGFDENGCECRLPARVLVECAAKRRILALHDLDPDERVDYECGEVEHNWPCPTLRLLVLPYVDHPDFRPEWAWT